MRKVIFVIDGSGSMSRTLRPLSKSLSRFAQDLTSKVSAEFAVIEFRGPEDDVALRTIKSSDELWTNQPLDVEGRIIQIRATGGAADGRECTGRAIKEAMSLVSSIARSDAAILLFTDGRGGGSLEESAEDRHSWPPVYVFCNPLDEQAIEEFSLLVEPPDGFIRPLWPSMDQPVAKADLDQILERLSSLSIVKSEPSTVPQPEPLTVPEPLLTPKATRSKPRTAPQPQPLQRPSTGRSLAEFLVMLLLAALALWFLLPSPPDSREPVISPNGTTPPPPADPEPPVLIMTGSERIDSIVADSEPQAAMVDINPETTTFADVLASLASPDRYHEAVYLNLLLWYNRPSLLRTHQGATSLLDIRDDPINISKLYLPNQAKMLIGHNLGVFLNSPEGQLILIDLATASSRDTASHNLTIDLEVTRIGPPRTETY